MLTRQANETGKRDRQRASAAIGLLARDGLTELARDGLTELARDGLTELARDGFTEHRGLARRIKRRLRGSRHARCTQPRVRV
jgi:hypothetical protein